MTADRLTGEDMGAAGRDCEKRAPGGSFFCAVQNGTERRQKGAETAVFGLIWAAVPHICAWTAGKATAKGACRVSRCRERGTLARHRAADPEKARRLMGC